MFHIHRYAFVHVETRPSPNEIIDQSQSPAIGVALPLEKTRLEKSIGFHRLDSSANQQKTFVFLFPPWDDSNGNSTFPQTQITSVIREMNGSNQSSEISSEVLYRVWLVGWLVGRHLDAKRSTGDGLRRSID